MSYELLFEVVVSRNCSPDDSGGEAELDDCGYKPLNLNLKLESYTFGDAVAMDVFKNVFVQYYKPY